MPELDEIREQIEHFYRSSATAEETDAGKTWALLDSIYQIAGGQSLDEFSATLGDDT